MSFVTSLLVIYSCFNSVTSDFVDHYATLFVCRDAEPKEVESAYLHLVDLFQPDKKGENESSDESEQFITIQKAYEVLSNPTTRETYNRNYPDAGLCKSWWISLRGEWDKLTISYRLKDLNYGIIQVLHDVFFNCQILTFQFIRNVVLEVPIFISKLNNAANDWIHPESIRWTRFSYSSKTYSRTYHKQTWWIPEYISFNDEDFLMVLGLSSVCLISKYLSRLKIVQAVSFPLFFHLVIFPTWLAVYLPWLVLEKVTVIFAIALVFCEIAAYRTFAREILSDILQNVDEGVKTHETKIFYYILVATIVSFPVFNKYRSQVHLFTPICICAVTHIATCVAVFKAMPFADAVSFFVCLTMLVILIDKFPITITVFMYLLIQITSGYCLDASPILFVLTISLVFISWPLSYLFEGARRSSLYYLQLLWYQLLFFLLQIFVLPTMEPKGGIKIIMMIVSIVGWWKLRWGNRFQTMDKYDLMGKEETDKALQALREYCRHDENGAIPHHLRDNKRFQQFLEGADHVEKTEQEEQIEENNVMALRQEISFYLILTFCCIFVMFIYEFY